MKIISFVISFLAIQAMPARAQDGAFFQLKAGVPAALTADFRLPAAGAAAPVSKAMLLRDPRTGNTVSVIPVGGGFIVAASGRYVQAVYNGSGYILRDGTYLAVVGGLRRASAAGRVQTAGAPAKELWKALDFAGKVEDMDFHAVDGGADVLAADSLSCVDENYVACNMFVNAGGERKMLFTLDGGAKLIRALYSNGFEFDEETGILYASRVSCSLTGGDYSCEVEP